MHWIDWSILIVFLGYTIWDGTRHGKESNNIKGFFLANRSMPWWAMGLSVMATQASAITFIGTTGQGYTEDMRFVQVYLAVPFAMVILCLTLVPYFNKMENFSAYEVLESRFGLSTRLLTSFLFLMSRSLAAGTIIAAPSYVLSLLLNLPLWSTILMIGTIATVYTMMGGITGVIRTDVKQMVVMILGLIFSFGWIWWYLPETVSMGDALTLAGSLGKLNTFDLTFDLSEKYNVWSGVIAALFLMLSYFGTDQSQVQRYLTARSLKDAQNSLLLSAYAKVPMQFFILLLGVMLYVFYIFQPVPISFRAAEPVEPPGSVEQKLEQTYESKFEQYHAKRKQSAFNLIDQPDKQSAKQFVQADKQLQSIRESELKRQAEIAGTDVNDTNYIFPYFILSQLPLGIVGLLVAGIFAAALSSIDSELNALSTIFIVDWYRRLRGTHADLEQHYVDSSRFTTFLFGAIATLAALGLGETNSIIELVNQIGSYFYGSILGVFILLLWVRTATGKSAIIGLLSGMTGVFFFNNLYYKSSVAAYQFILPFTMVPGGYEKSIEYLWLNPLGTVIVVMVGYIVGYFTKSK